MVLIRSISLFAFLYCVSAQQLTQPRTSAVLKQIPPRCRDGHYFIPIVAVNSAESRAICKKYGGRLASVNNDNFEVVTSLLFNCSGPQKRAWIREWDGLNYNLNCLALYTGTSGPGGSIDTSCTGKRQPSLCSVPGKILPETVSLDTIEVASQSVFESAIGADENQSSLATGESDPDVDFSETDNSNWVLKINSVYNYIPKEEIS